MLKAFWEPCQTSELGLFVKIFNDFQLLPIFAKSSILKKFEISFRNIGSHSNEKFSTAGNKSGKNYYFIAKYSWSKNWSA